VVRAAVVPVMEGIPLWHERDISHSSTERVFLPDAAITTDYLLHLTTGPGGDLVVDADRMRANLDSTGGLIYTSAVLLELVECGPVAGGRLRAGAGRGDGDVERRRRRSGRRCARGRPPAGVALDEARLDEICRPEGYVRNLGPLFDRLAALS
jgi:adenylosuccinate lyase